jgi:hypothetical protein
MKKIIIAPNYESYVRCCHHNCLNQKEVPFITEASQIEKIDESVEPIFFGAIEDTPQYREIVRVMRSKGIRVKGEYVKRRSTEIIDVE